MSVNNLNVDLYIFIIYLFQSAFNNLENCIKGGNSVEEFPTVERSCLSLCSIFHLIRFEKKHTIADL